MRAPAMKVCIDRLNCSPTARIVRQQPELIAEAEVYKNETVQYVEEIYKKHANRPKQIDELLYESSKLTELANEEKAKLDELIANDVVQTRTLVEDYKTKLENLAVYLALCSHVCKIHEDLRLVERLHEEKRYEKAMAELMNLERYVVGIPDDEKIDSVKELQLNVSVEKQKLLAKLNEVVKSSVTCRNVKAGDLISSTVTICKNGEVDEALNALSEYQDNIVPLDAVTRFLWDHVYIPIVRNSCKLSVESNEDSSTIRVDAEEQSKDGYATVFENLITFSEFLHEHFSRPLKKHVNTLEYIGVNIRDNLSELIIKSCLDDTIPTTAEGLQKYDEVIKSTEQLQNKLVETGIFAQDTTSILEHANNVDILFINKKCKEYTATAIEMMKKDLHDTITVGVILDPAKFSSDEFPQCSISKSVQEVLKLIQKILTKAKDSPDVSAGRLYETARNILIKYGTTVTSHHSKLLQTIPQQIAIFYNNCLYISYEVTQPPWKETVQLVPKIIGADPTHFESIGEDLYRVANNMFQQYLEEQMTQIKATVKSAQLDSLHWCEKLDAVTEKSVRQCLRQQELLKTVWQKVLNYHDYNKSIGFLLDSLCSALINSVINVEDISSDSADQFVDILKLVQTRGPKLFTDPKEICIYVESWQRLVELMFVLSSSLMNIDDRWADGKGPLALHFTPLEVRGLIKALFQNTELRASILSKMRDNKV